MKRYTVYGLSALTPNYASRTSFTYPIRVLAVIRAGSLNRWNRKIGTGVVHHFEVRP